MGKYEINEKTLALKPKNTRTMVYEDDRSFMVNEPATKIMEDSCTYYGSSLKGRKKGAQKVLKTRYKVPIIVEDVNNIIFFPTKSDRRTECAWISLNNIDNYYKENDDMYIRFKNGKVLKVDESYNIIDRQILNATRLGCLMQERRKKLQKKVKK